MKKIVFKSLGLFVCVMLIPLFTYAQNVTVTGSVKDVTGEVLIGATVLEEGTQNGTVTDANGNFSLNVSSKGKLVISFIGFESQTLLVGDNTNFNVILQDDAQSLNEVVVIGYGSQRRESVTGSVASMQGNELKEVQTGNITSALAGRVAGVQMSQTDSKPGADMQIRIRGTRSLSGDNNPLIVLDGIPFAGTLGDINTNDIKSIDILKDASATSIYGSRGANGVIIVTTNRGFRDQKPQVTYDVYYGFKTLYNRYPMMSGDELYQLRADAGIYSEVLGDGSKKPTMGKDEILGMNTDWQDLMFKTASTMNHNLAITGGTATGNYNIGLGYIKDESLLPGQNYSRISLRASIDQQIGDYFRFGLTTNNNYNMTKGQNLIMYNSLSLSSLIDPYNEDRSWKRVVSSIADNYWAFSRKAINELGDKYADRQRGIGSYNSIYGEVKIPRVEGLTYRMTVGLNVRTRDRGTYQGEGVFSDTPTAASNASLDKSVLTNWTVENLITYERIFAEKHHVTANALYSAEKTHYDRSYVTATDIPSDHFQYYNLGQAPADKISVLPANQDFEEYGLQSYMGRLMYDYDSRYMLLASYRRDGSSRLAKGHKWIDYVAFSGGWNIAKESFMSKYEWLDELKARVGYGVTSNQAVRPYATQGRLATRPYNFGEQMTIGYYVSETPNPELGWEFSKTWNIGLDFSVLNRRLSGTVEWYRGITNDVLQFVNLPGSGGVGGYYDNIGKVKNSGLEVSLNGTILDDVNGWTWDAGINFYANRNEITELASGQERDEANAWFVGHSINSVFDYKKIGLWQEGDPYLNVLEPGGNAGMIKVKYTGGYNADGTPERAIDAADRQILNADPDWQGGFNTRVAYKGWDLNVIGTFQHGGLLVSSLHASNGYLNMLTGRRGNVKVDYWTPENTGAKYPKPGGIQSGDNPKYGSTLGYFDASYFKVGSITLGYNFDDMKWVKDTGISRARLYFTLQNAFVLFSPFNKETGLDPVTNSHGNENAAVTGSLPYNASTMLTVGTNVPSTRNFIFGLSLSF
ncbi:MAG: TonB-dependent receptor [Culturomica sp.]|jgi:TonB-linked SusC/RagA family outer membrane protein|nr:TonB-dependent receptor [Culturomica sp.]